MYVDFEPDDRFVFGEEILGKSWGGRHIKEIIAGRARTSVAPSQDYYGFFTSGALRYFSIGISKYISSVPFASWTPVR